MSRSPPQQDGPSGGGGACNNKGRRSHPASSASRKDHAAAVEQQNVKLQQLAEAMASLQLPQPTSGPSLVGIATPSSSPDSSPPNEAAAEVDETPSPAASNHEHPTITLLVVADIDLASASELSEYALRHRLHIDLCIACGSFCRDEDLAKMAAASSLASSLSSSLSTSSPIASSSPASYGRNDDEPHQRGGFGGRGGGDGVSSAPIDRAMAGGRGGLRNIMALAGPNKSQSPNCWYPRRSATGTAAAVGTATDGGSSASSTGGGGSERCGWDATPFFRTREETSALEGLLTATLSQLENIVCRVVYCPGSTDPITSCLGRAAAPNEELGATSAAAHRPHPRRYTPNSRNLHRQWLPLAPGLGTAALLYLDCSDDLVQDATAALLRWSSAPGGGSHSKKRGGGGVDVDRHHDDDDEEEDEDDEDDEDNEANENIALWIEQLKQLKQQ
jgi:hypothetical protein